MHTRFASIADSYTEYRETPAGLMLAALSRAHASSWFEDQLAHCPLDQDRRFQVMKDSAMQNQRSAAYLGGIASAICLEAY